METSHQFGVCLGNLRACLHCGEDVTLESDFCPHCGELFISEGQLQCEVHSERDALGICIICHAAVCRKCRHRVWGRTFCGDHKRVEVAQDWANVFESSDVHEAEFIRSLLESHDFKVLVQNFQSIGFTWHGGESAVSRSQLGKPAKVFVPIPTYLRAQKTIKEWENIKNEADDSHEENK